MKKLLLPLFMIGILVSVGGFYNSASASAHRLSYYDGVSRVVKITKTTTVFRVNMADSYANSYPVGRLTLHKGTRIHVMLTYHGWMVNSNKKYHNTAKYKYYVNRSAANKSWFK